MAMLLVAVLPALLIMCALFNQPFMLQPLPPFLARAAETISPSLLPLDRLLSPLFELAARSMGVSSEELLRDESSDCEVMNRLKRILIGLLVLNIVVSIVMLCALAIFVVAVRLS